MLAAWCASAAVPIEPILVQIVSFEIAINGFAAGTCSAATRRRLHYDEWRFVLLGYLRRREPGLLQRGVLAEQRFLQRPSHRLSLLTLKFLAPPVRPSASAVSARARPVTLISTIRRNGNPSQSNRTPNPQPAGAVPTRFELAISSLTGTHVGPLHHGTWPFGRLRVYLLRSRLATNGSFHRLECGNQRFLA